MKIKTLCKETVNGCEIPRKLIYDGKTLIIQTPMSKAKDTCVPVENLLECKYQTKTELTSKDKSVIGRAIVGGLLFGSVGAVVGGISGTGQKIEKKRKFYFAVAYAENGENVVRIFEDYPSSKTYKIANAFNKRWSK